MQQDTKTMQYKTKQATTEKKASGRNIFIELWEQAGNGLIFKTANEEKSDVSKQTSKQTKNETKTKQNKKHKKTKRERKK